MSAGKPPGPRVRAQGKAFELGKVMSTSSTLHAVARPIRGERA